MSAENYVILERLATQGTKFQSGVKTGMPGDACRVRSAELDAESVRKARSQPGTHLAPVCPMTLPLAVPPHAEPGPVPTEAWGVKAVRAHESPYDGEGVTVALLDTGIDIDHPAFEAIKGRVTVRDFTGEGTADTNGHGTHCAGTIFGGDVKGTRIGIAPGISRALVGKVLGRRASTQTVTAGIEWAVREGAHVISMSLGFAFNELHQFYLKDGYPAEIAISKALEGYRANLDLFTKLVDYQMQGAALRHSAVLFVAASGNESRRKERDDFSATACPPAASQGVLSVGAVESDPEGRWKAAPYSNSRVSVCAPGSNILSAALGGLLAERSGTSMAAPHVAGVAALWAQKLLQTKGVLRPVDWQFELESHATPGGRDANPDLIGRGLVQAPVER